MFEEIHKMSASSYHPVRPHTLGWARLDLSQPEHAHIDEIQSDLGQGAIRQLERAAAEGSMNESDVKEKVNGIKRIIKICSGQFKG